MLPFVIALVWSPLASMLSKQQSGQVHAFAPCAITPSNVLPPSVITIMRRAIYECYGLQSIVLHASATTIVDEAFYSCRRSLQSLSISSLTSTTPFEVGVDEFAHCASMQSAVVSPLVMSIGNAAFYHCTSLESIVIPASATKIGGRSIFIPASGNNQGICLLRMQQLGIHCCPCFRNNNRQ
mmetsp:Transcript_3685/g.6298  ORF Transcript_3685/g.6298 Transcript_3685/m.6298 type:complete len:182 (-) Transcript_3685:80-625(-)